MDFLCGGFMVISVAILSKTPMSTKERMIATITTTTNATTINSLGETSEIITKHPATTQRISANILSEPTASNGTKPRENGSKARHDSTQNINPHILIAKLQRLAGIATITTPSATKTIGKKSEKRTPGKKRVDA